MPGKTFVEKILGTDAGAIVFKEPDIVLTHDNTASIKNTFEKMGGERVKYPDRLLVALDHNAPPTTAKLANQYQTVREFAASQGIAKFHDAGDGICHQIMSEYAKPGMIIVGSDSHTCTAGAFNALAAGIDRTEAAGLWKRGETWFRAPETMKVVLRGKLPEGVFAKDISLWIIGKIGAAGANYMSIEFHGDGVANLGISERMTLTNLASEMGAKNAVFPCDDVLRDFLGDKTQGIWADDDASYAETIEIDLEKLYPLCAAPHQVENVKAISEVEGVKIQQGVIGTCTNGRLEDLREAASVLSGMKIADGFQLLVIPASKAIYLRAIKEGVIGTLFEAGATVLSASCGPCLGTGQGIPADGFNILSTANRNFLGRMGNKNANVYLASPAAVAYSAMFGEIRDPRGIKADDKFPYARPEQKKLEISEGDNRKFGKVWDYSDADNLNTDQMFAGNLTYEILSSDADAITPHLFKGFDPSFAERVEQGDIILAGENFGCGSSREHPAVGLARAGVVAVIAKSVNRIFFRSSVNQGLPIIILPKAVEAYEQGAGVDVDFESGKVTIGSREFEFAPPPEKLSKIFEHKGLVNYLKTEG